MANWITHLRVAQSVVNKIDFPVDLQKYYIGTIATDCGDACYDNNGKLYYNPPRYITHWTDNSKAWDAPIHFDRFYDCYIKNETDLNKKSFYVGYYVHLITDAIWIELVSRPVIESFKPPQEYNKAERKKFRDDWCHTELIYLQNNPDFYPIELLKTVEHFENSYLDYASTKAINTNINWIIHNSSSNDVINEATFNYFTYQDYETVIKTIESMVKMILLSK